MGLLSKIIGDGPMPAAATTLAEPSADCQETAGGPPGAVTAPSPCPRCHSPAFWIDVYGGPPHCRFCQPPPAASMVRRFVWLVGSVDDASDDGPRLVEFHPAPSGLLGMVEVDAAATEAEEANRSSGLRGATIERDGRTWTILAAPHQVDVLRLPIKGTTVDGRPDLAGRYSPPLGVAPVGDLLLDEWWKSLPEGLPGWESGESKSISSALPRTTPSRPG